MYSNGKKPQKPGKTPSNYSHHRQIQEKLDSAFDNLDIFDKTDNVVTFKTDKPSSYPVEDCDNNTTIPYDDQLFLQSSPIHQGSSNHFLSSWTGYPVAPTHITPLRPSIIRRPTIPSSFNTRPPPPTTSLQTPQHFSLIYPSLQTSTPSASSSATSISTGHTVTSTISTAVSTSIPASTTTTSTGSTTTTTSTGSTIGTVTGQITTAPTSSTSTISSDITLYGVLTQADKYKSKDPKVLKREKEFMRALGIPNNRFARIKNYCPDIDPNMTYEDTIIPSLDVPVLRLLRQVLTAEPTDQDYEHRQTKNGKYVPNLSDPCVALIAAVIAALVLFVLFNVFVLFLRI